VANWLRFYAASVNHLPWRPSEINTTRCGQFQPCTYNGYQICHLFDIQNLYIMPAQCFKFHAILRSAIISENSYNHLAHVNESDCVFCKVGNTFLCNI
jgi:hypothetical protein